MGPPECRSGAQSDRSRWRREMGSRRPCELTCRVRAGGCHERNQEEISEKRRNVCISSNAENEFCVADLFGRNVRERATALTEIAHPDFRAELLAQAKQRHPGSAPTSWP